MGTENIIMYDLVPKIETCLEMKKLGFPQDTSFFMWEREPKAPEDDPLNYALVTKLTYYNYEFVAAPTIQEILPSLAGFHIGAHLDGFCIYFYDSMIDLISYVPSDTLGMIWIYYVSSRNRTNECSLLSYLKKYERDSMKLGEI